MLDLNYEEVLRSLIYLQKLTRRSLFYNKCNQATVELVTNITILVITYKIEYDDEGKAEPAWYLEKIFSDGCITIRDRVFFGLKYRYQKFPITKKTLSEMRMARGMTINRWKFS